MGSIVRTDRQRALCCAPGLPETFFAIRAAVALGSTANSLTAQYGISIWNQFHLPPIFRPLRHALT